MKDMNDLIHSDFNPRKQEGLVRSGEGLTLINDFNDIRIITKFKLKDFYEIKNEEYALVEYDTKIYDKKDMSVLKNNN